MIKYCICLLILLNSFCYGQLQWSSVTTKKLNQAVLVLLSDTIHDRLFIGGAFKYYGLNNYSGVAQWDGSQLLNMDCGLGDCGSNGCGGVRDFEFFKNELYSLSYEDSIGCQNVHHLAKWNGTSWINLNQIFYLNSTPTLLYSMDVVNSLLIVCGNIDSILNKRIQGITKYDGVSWDTAFYCNIFTNNSLLIHPLTVYNNEIYAQNLLEDSNGNEQIFSRWRNNCWEKVASAFSNRSGNIRKMIVYKNELYIAGSFDPNHDPQSPGNSIARWNGVRWDDVGGGIRLLNPNYLPEIWDMSIYNNELYVVGSFEKAGMLDVSNIAKWDGTKWCSLGSHFDNSITSIAIYHDSLFIGGAFKTIDADSVFYFAKCYLNNYTDTCQVVGVEEIYKNKINIFPNPTKDKIKIQSNNIKIDDLKIINLLGMEIYKENNFNSSNQLDVSFLNSGLYYIIIETKEGRAVNKFIKE